MKQSTLKEVELFGLPFAALTMEETMQLVDTRIKSGEATHLLGMNADKINEMTKNSNFTVIAKEADIINADGASIILASKFLNKPLPERVAGIDLMQQLLKLAEQKEYSVYFLGAKEDTVTTMKQKLLHTYPKLIIKGYRNGYFEKSEWSDIAHTIKQLAPDIVFIGITSPLKEYLTAYFMEQGISSIYMGVGGSFDVLSGQIKRAPIWMQNYNLEWLFRIQQEPGRLFMRYFLGNIKFIRIVLSEKYRSRQ